MKLRSARKDVSITPRHNPVRIKRTDNTRHPTQWKSEIKGTEKQVYPKILRAVACVFHSDRCCVFLPDTGAA